MRATSGSNATVVLTRFIFAADVSAMCIIMPKNAHHDAPPLTTWQGIGVEHRYASVNPPSQWAIRSLRASHPAEVDRAATLARSLGQRPCAGLVWSTDRPPC